MAVTDHKDRTVKFFTPDGNTGLSWQPHMFDWPDGITTTATGKYVITDWNRGQVSIHDTNGLVLRSFSSQDTGSDGDYSCPAYVSVDRHHRILITDTFDHMVKVFDQSGSFLFKFGGDSGSTGSNPQCSPGGSRRRGVINDPRGICTDVMNNILVADWGGGCINKYSPDGVFIETVLSSGGDDASAERSQSTVENGNRGHQLSDHRQDQVEHPWGIAATDTGLLLVSEQKMDKKDPKLKLFQCSNHDLPDV